MYPVSSPRHIATIKQWVVKPLLIIFLSMLSGCTYLKYASIQNNYKRLQEAKPSQLVLKHMIDHQSYFVVGRVTGNPRIFSNQQTNAAPTVNMSVSAYSNRFSSHERVDTMQSITSDTHFGLNLPQGDYEVYVIADLNHNDIYEPEEVVGSKEISLNPETAPENVITQFEIELSKPQTIAWIDSFPVVHATTPDQSLFYPANTIRSLEDPIFDRGMSTLGMYDPAAFLEKAPTLFYALEEDLGYKIPVIFVHGIGGSIREFAPILDQLDRSRFRPWFFYYPSGGDLNQLAEVFYSIFLSGDVIPQTYQPYAVVAHSMGGLIVREAINLYKMKEKENRIELFISITTPFGGHAASAMGEKHGIIVLPAWRDLNPQNAYITQLFRKPLPEFTHHMLYYAFGNDDFLKNGENSDGVVSLSSQLRTEVQTQSSRQMGINATHTGILNDDGLISDILNQLDTLKNYFPDDHLEYLHKGGMPIADEEKKQYHPMSVYFFENLGVYFCAMSTGQLKPLQEFQQHFVDTVRGTKSPNTDLEKDWLKYIQLHPEALK